jgi:hypothetical protein
MTWDDPIYMGTGRATDDAHHVAEMMACKGVDMDVDAVRLLISKGQQAHRRCLSDWLRRYEPECKTPRSTGPYKKWENPGRGSPGRFRDGSDIPREPLAAIYIICNEFYRRELGLRFWPDFTGLRVGNDYEGLERIDFLNEAALFFLLVARAINEIDYSVERCEKIHNKYYLLLNKTLD